MLSIDPGTVALLEDARREGVIEGLEIALWHVDAWCNTAEGPAALGKAIRAEIEGLKAED